MIKPTQDFPPMAQKPKRYLVQKHVMASSVQEAIAKEPETPITSVFPDANQEPEKAVTDAIGFKCVDRFFPYEYTQVKKERL